MDEEGRPPDTYGMLDQGVRAEVCCSMVCTEKERECLQTMACTWVIIMTSQEGIIKICLVDMGCQQGLHGTDIAEFMNDRRCVNVKLKVAEGAPRVNPAYVGSVCMPFGDDREGEELSGGGGRD